MAKYFLVSKERLYLLIQSNLKTKNMATKTIAVTAKNITSKAVSELSLNEIIFQLAGKGKKTNDEIRELLAKAKRKISDSSLAWYASKARAGVRR